MFARSGTRTNNLLRNRRLLHQLRQSSTYWATVFVVYKLCLGCFLGCKSSIYMSFFWPTLLLYLKDNHFRFPAKVLHYQMQNFVAGNLILYFSADSKFFWSCFFNFFQVVYLLHVEWLSDEGAYVFELGVEVVCGGTLVDEGLILTAAHCFGGSPLLQCKLVSNVEKQDFSIHPMKLKPIKSDWLVFPSVKSKRANLEPLMGCFINFLAKKRPKGSVFYIC